MPERQRQAHAAGEAALAALDGATDPIERLALLDPIWRARAIAAMPRPHRDELIARWLRWAHDGQRAPVGDWRVWLIMAGRGFGKTRAGAEWISDLARRRPGARIALVGATIEDVERVMINGPSGILAVARDGEAPRWARARGELVFDTGAVAQVFSAVAAEKLRGPEHDAAWCDEAAKWGKQGAVAWHNLMMTMRGNDDARILVTTTPKPSTLMTVIEQLAVKDGAVTRGRTTDNPHLPASFVAAMLDEYGGTRLGRQELDGELLTDIEGAMWTGELLERCRVRASPASPDGLGKELVRIVVGVDPPAGSDRGAGDACGIIVAGIDTAGIGHVLADASVQASSPEGWARAVAAAAGAWGADRVVAEANNGGHMVRSVLKGADIRLPVKLVRASQGKSARAEPVFTLYEAGRVRHRDAFPTLEDEMCGLLLGGGYEGPGRSPDRADALVWALTELMLQGKAAVRMRRL